MCLKLDQTACVSLKYGGSNRAIGSSVMRYVGLISESDKPIYEIRDYKLFNFKHFWSNFLNFWPVEPTEDINSKILHIF